MVTELVHQYGTKAWSDICKHLPGRTNKQCRDRWVVFIARIVKVFYNFIKLLS